MISYVSACAIGRIQVLLLASLRILSGGRIRTNGTTDGSWRSAGVFYCWLPKFIDKQADVPWNWVFPHVWHAWHVRLEGQCRVHVERWVVLRRYWKSVALGFNVSFLIQDGAKNFKKCTFLDLINSIESTSCNSKFDSVWQSGFI